MKKHYRKVRDWRNNTSGDEYRYLHANVFIHRQIRTFPELRENYGVRHDYRGEIKVRLARNTKTLDPWNDFPVGRNWKRCWKDFTRHRKQWMVGSDPKITPRRRDGLPRLLNIIADLNGLDD